MKQTLISAGVSLAIVVAYVHLVAPAISKAMAASTPPAT